MSLESSLPPLEVFMLGLVDFDDVQRVQRRLVYDLGEGSGAGLILCEHPPTISVGRSGSRMHIVPDDQEIRALEIDVRWVNRGGGCILHLPGQLAAYLVFPLDRFGLSLQQYVEGLHEALVRVLGEFDLHGERHPGRFGVFLGQARVATVGVAVNRWVAYHGLTLNVGPFLSPFAMIEEPGFGPCPLRQTSIESRRQRPAPMPRVREALIRQIESVFNLERHHIYTQHPLVRRKVCAHVFAQSAR